MERLRKVEGVFGSRRKLRKAVNQLMARGVPTNTIHVYLVDRAGSRLREVSVEAGSGVARGAVLGSLSGAAIGLVIVVAATAGLFGSPAADPFGVASVPEAVGVMLLGAAAGVPLGGLLGMGHWQGARRIPDADFTRYGATLVVETRSMADVARTVLADAGARSVTSVPAS